MANGQVNGLHIRPAFIYTLACGLVAGGVWLGATDLRQHSTKTALDGHVAAEAHPKAQNRLTTLETHYFYIQRDLKEIKELLKRQQGFSGSN
jgi:hypothetical protein